MVYKTIIKLLKYLFWQNMHFRIESRISYTYYESVPSQWISVVNVFIKEIHIKLWNSRGLGELNLLNYRFYMI